MRGEGCLVAALVHAGDALQAGVAVEGVLVHMQSLSFMLACMVRELLACMPMPCADAAGAGGAGGSRER